MKGDTMRTFWIVYDEEQYKINGWFADRLTELLSGSFDAKLVLTSHLAAGVADGRVEFTYKKVKIAGPDFACVRTIDPFLSRVLELSGARVFNPAGISAIANDKRLSYAVAAAAGVRVADTFFEIRNSKAGPADFLGEDAFPLVAKAASGHGGKQVEAVENRREFAAAKRRSAGKDKMLAQRFVPAGTSDVRVYVLGGSIFKAVRRVSGDGFKSNYSLGGSAEPYDLTKDEENAVMKIVSALGTVPDFVGIDFFPDVNGPVFNEIEDVAGTRMLYSVYGIDAAKVYADYMTNQALGGLPGRT